MKGKYHLIITFFIILPFLLVLYKRSFDLIYLIIFLFFCMVGSLLPDVDSGKKSKIYFNFRFFYFLVFPLMKILTLIFRKKKFFYSLKEGEHRGIMHSFFGIFLVSLYFFILFYLVSKFFNLNYFYSFYAFLGIFLGQFFHLIEDSFTKSGIDWGFPFKRILVKGKFKTKNEFWQFVIVLILIVLIVFFFIKFKTFLY